MKNDPGAVCDLCRHAIEEAAKADASFGYTLTPKLAPCTDEIHDLVVENGPDEPPCAELVISVCGATREAAEARLAAELAR